MLRCVSIHQRWADRELLVRLVGQPRVEPVGTPPSGAGIQSQLVAIAALPGFGPMSTLVCVWSGVGATRTAKDR